MFNFSKAKKLIAAIAVSTAAIFTMTGCGGGDNAANDNKSNDSNKLRVGSTIDFAPFEFQDEGQKDYQGFDMDLIRAIGKEMGKEVEISNIGFDGLIPALEAKNIDVIISGMTITEERKQKVAFSEPYYQSGLTMVVRADETSIRTFGDLEGKRIAVQIGTTSATEAKKIPNAEVREFNTPADCFMELKNNGADAVINDRPVNDYFIKKEAITGLVVLPDRLTAEEYGIAIGKDNTEVQQLINEGLRKIRENGEYDKIFAKWFGEENK